MTTDRAARNSHDTKLPNSSSQDAAIRGASLAFGKPPVKPKPQINTYSGSNGALAAATRVGGGTPSRQHDKKTTVSRFEGEEDDMKLGYQNTGGSVANSVNLDGLARSPSRPRMSRLDSTGFLHPPRATTDQVKSPSFIAATLAASRSASISPNPTGQQMSAADLRRQASFSRGSPSRRRSSSRESSDRVLDTTPIPPTTSLIGMFEQNARNSGQERRPVIRRTATVAMRSPTPTHVSLRPALTGMRSPSPSPVQRSQRSPQPPKPRQRSMSPVSRPLKPEVKREKPMLKQATGPPQLPDPPKPAPAPKKPSVAVPKPIPIPKPKPKPVPTETQNESCPSNDSFVSASDHKPSPSFRTTLTRPNKQRLTSASAISVNSSTTIDSMANAIVASSLASSRTASPAKQLTVPPPPPPSRRSPRSHSHLFHNSKDISRTPSPSKQSTLRTTMRKPKPYEEEDEGDKRRSKKHIMKKHPNKHHEGDRKRWRDEITERERKRYEAVWASNRGLHISPSMPGSEYAVCNLVVKDIWSRSRLHDDVLEEAYGLVDRGRNGVLEKEEFVVGLWLVDQRLKGRKLPLRVSDHVWRSVGSLGGIKIRKAGK